MCIAPEILHMYVRMIARLRWKTLAPQKAHLCPFSVSDPSIYLHTLQFWLLLPEIRFAYSYKTSCKQELVCVLLLSIMSMTLLRVVCSRCLFFVCV